MKPSQVSLNSVMAAVVLIALDFMTIRTMEIPPTPITLVLSLIVLGCLPMANILAVGLAILIRRGLATAPFWLGFVVSRGIAALTNLAITIARPDVVMNVLELTEPALKFVGDRTGLASSPAGEVFLLFGVVPAL